MNLEELKKKKAKELQQKKAEKQLEALKKQIFRQVLTSKARSRLTNIKMARPEMGKRIELAIIQLIQTGRLKRIDEETLITLIKQLKGSKPETTITRR